MSSELPALRPQQVVKAFENAGFTRWRQRGSHLTLRREQDGRVLTIPVRFAKTVPKGTLRAIVRQSGLTVEQFRKLL